MSLCSVCQKIDFFNLPELPVYYDGYSMPHGKLLKYINSQARLPGQDPSTLGQFTQSIGILHHQSLAELTAAAPSCSICTLIERGVSESVKILEEAEKDEQYVYYKERAGYDEPSWRLEFVRRRDGLEGFMVVSLPEKRESRGFSPWVLTGVGFCVREEDPLASVVPGRDIQKSAGSDITVNRALNWVRECTTEHQGRCVVNDTELPSRVLDVQSSSSPSELRLYEPKGELGRYTALSHVWGDNRHFMTTHSNIDAHRERISFNDLPKTHQDAVTLTRKLGIKYLWIDSLCICQNDGPEWERESAKMHSIYANAYITIAATGTAQDYNGFLTERPDVEYTQFPCTKDGLKGTIQAFPVPPQYVVNVHSHTQLSDEPLSKRGWALQERYLGTRILHFGSKQMYYECYHHFLSEDGVRVPGRLTGIHEDTHSEDDAKNPYRGSGLWYGALDSYYPRALTKSSDKLPALSGIVRTVEEQTGDKYVAGLWHSQIIEGLIWQAMGKPSRPPEYRAPSWSWASIDGAFGNLGLVRTPWDPDQHMVWKDVAVVLDCHVELKGENPYGEVKDAWLKMRAPLEPLFPSEEKEPDWETVPHARNMRLRTKTGDPFGSYCMLDTIKEEEARKMELFALVLVRRVDEEGVEKEDDSCHQCLIVRPVEGRADVYERVGKILMNSGDLGERGWLEDEGKYSTVTLI